MSFFVLLYLLASIACLSLSNLHVLAAPALLRFPHSPPTPPVPTVPSQQDIDQYLYAHNHVRAAHGATSLTWSPSLAQDAQIWADQCQFRHSNGKLRDELYGENIVAATGHFPINAAMKTFSSDESQFNAKKPIYNHFTQVVWKSTTQLGCAVSKCDDIFSPVFGQATLYVCLYDPVGNVVGQAGSNVQV